MRWPRLKLVSLVTAAALLLTCGITTAGTVPNTLNYQGTVYDGTGQPVTGTRDVTVSLYDVASGGTAFWTEAQTGIIFKNGNFSIVLGKSPDNPLGQTAQAKFSGETYIGIKIGTDPEMVPRQQFSSIAYALKSGDGVPVGGIIMWSGAIDQIPAGWTLCDGTNGTPDLRDRFVVGAGNSYQSRATGGNATINLQHSHIANDHVHTGKTDGPDAYNDVQKGDGHTAADSGHRHTFTTGGASDRGMSASLSTAQDIRPPFYALAFIMKLQ